MQSDRNSVECVDCNLQATEASIKISAGCGSGRECTFIFPVPFGSNRILKTVIRYMPIATTAIHFVRGLNETTVFDTGHLLSTSVGFQSQQLVGDQSLRTTSPITAAGRRITGAN